MLLFSVFWLCWAVTQGCKQSTLATGVQQKERREYNWDSSVTWIGFVLCGRVRIRRKNLRANESTIQKTLILRPVLLYSIMNLISVQMNYMINVKNYISKFKLEFNQNTHVLNFHRFSTWMLCNNKTTQKVALKNR